MERLTIVESSEVNKDLRDKAKAKDLENTITQGQRQGQGPKLKGQGQSQGQDQGHRIDINKTKIGHMFQLISLLPRSVLSNVHLVFCFNIISVLAKCMVMVINYSILSMSSSLCDIHPLSLAYIGLFSLETKFVIPFT